MKVQELFEDKAAANIVKANRVMKFSLRNGENSFGVELDKIKCEFYDCGYFVYVGKPKELKVGEKYVFENSEKPGFYAYRNMKHNGHDHKVERVLSDLKEVLAHLKTDRNPTMIINPALLNGAKAPAVKKDEAPEDLDDGYFLLGCWADPYGKLDEYFWSGVYYTKKAAAAVGKSKMERGQPKTMRDWADGPIRVIRGKDKFLAAAKKVGLNPNVSDLEWND